MKFTVAIDGPAAAGKGTISRAVAEHFGFAHLDTGLLYRATGRRVMLGEEPVAAAQNLQPDDLKGADLRSADVAQAASRIASIAEVRAALVDFQRAFALRLGGAVLDGRDIGTVICPDADAKLYVTASDEVRAQRRFDEMVASGSDTSLEQVLQDLQARDTRDRERHVAPMQPAEDATLMDTSDMAIEEAVRQAVAIVQAKMDGTGD